MSGNASAAPAIEVQITYLAPGSFINRRFMLTRHRSAVGNFLDKNEVNAVYPAELATMGWTARTSGDLSRYVREEVGYRHQGGVQPPAGVSWSTGFPSERTCCGP
jgi:hypothetical protein